MVVSNSNVHFITISVYCVFYTSNVGGYEEMKSYIEFKEIPTTTKTKRFEVISKTDGSKLGEIKWHSPYRKYALFVTSKYYEDNFILMEDTKIFDTNCLKEIIAFIGDLMDKRFVDKLMEDKNK